MPTSRIRPVEGLEPLEGREAESWETHHLAGSSDWSHGPATGRCCPGSYCSNCQLQPWSTALFPSRGGTAFRGAGKSRQQGQICKSRQDVQRLLKCSASPKRTSRGTYSPKGRKGPLQLKCTKLREWELQLQPQAETHSKLAKLGAHLPRGDQPRGLRSGGPRLYCSPTEAAASLTCREFASRTCSMATLQGKLRQARYSGAPSLGGSVIGRPQQWSAPSFDPTRPAASPLGQRALYRPSLLTLPGPPTCTARPGPAPCPSPGRVAFQLRLFQPA